MSGECPLKHTSIAAAISGMVARVDVVQEYENPFAGKIEAVYTFPLPHDAAVDRMTMTVGTRVIEGQVLRRDEARRLYQAARESGRVAGLLNQERPNVFTQLVANIEPGNQIRIRISYVQTLKFEDGRYEFVAPLVVAPRYHPAGSTDARKLSPPVAPEGTRAGHDVSLDLSIDAGIPIGNVASPTHEIDTTWLRGQSARVKLRGGATIPNKDFILRYESASGSIADAILTHRSAKGGFFTLLLQPPPKTGAAAASPKELIFVLDTSGSMMGFPIEKAKEAMHQALAGLYPGDTFNLITFSGDTEVLFPQPVPATPENLAVAQLFLNSRSGRGGTEMMKAIRAALDPTPGSGRLRIACFMTDGEVGNDSQILAEVRKHPDTRVFAFGIGGSVNRHLLDGMARLGRGDVEYVGLKDDGSAAARRFHQRVRDPLLTDIEIDWGGLNVSEVYPRRIPDLFGAKPVVVTGRYAGAMRGTVRLRGRQGSVPTTRTVAVDLPGAEARHDALASLWARHRVADLMDEPMTPENQQAITEAGIAYGISTPYTSFLAVEEQTITTGGKSKRVRVPIDMPEGMSYEGTLGRSARGFAVMGGVAGGTPGGVVGGIIGSVPSVAPLPPPPPATREVLPPVPGKLDPELAAMSAQNPSVEVEVQVLLRDASASTFKLLGDAGLRVLKPAGADLMLTGRILAGKLPELSRIDAIRFIVKRKP
jgi:Ca-activated chloride channel family protein